jgi:hypothetical protein
MGTEGVYLHNAPENTMVEYGKWSEVWEVMGSETER